VRTLGRGDTVQRTEPQERYPPVMALAGDAPCQPPLGKGAKSRDQDVDAPLGKGAKSRDRDVDAPLGKGAKSQVRDYKPGYSPKAFFTAKSIYSQTPRKL